MASKNKPLAQQKAKNASDTIAVLRAQVAALQHKDKMSEKRIEKAERERKSAEEETAIQKQIAKIAEQVRLIAELGKTKAEKEKLTAEQEKARAELATDKTTLDEFLAACHDHFQLNLKVRMRTYTTTKGLKNDGPKPETLPSPREILPSGGMTNIRHKWYPERLEPWTNFTEEHQKIFDDARYHFHPRSNKSTSKAPKRFHSRQYFAEEGPNVAERTLSIEDDLRGFERDTVERHAAKIINTLMESKSARSKFKLGNRIIFESHAKDLEDETEPFLGKKGKSQEPRTPEDSGTETEDHSEDDHDRTNKGSKRKQKKCFPDQYCIYSQGDTDSSKKLLFLLEYKPPHKLILDYILAGFRSMSFMDDVWTRLIIPYFKDPGNGRPLTKQEEEAREEKLQYNADLMFAAITTQTFHTMIEFGAEFSYISTGQAFVFLRVREEDPTTLYYHVSVPADLPKFGSDQATPESLSQTAIGQVVGFSLMAFKSKNRPQTWRDDAKSRLQRHEIDWDEILKQIPESERKEPRISSDFKPRSTNIFKKEYSLRPLKDRTISTDDDYHPWNKKPGPRDDDSDDEGPDDSIQYDRRSQAARQVTAGKKSGNADQKRSTASSSTQGNNAGTQNRNMQCEVLMSEPQKPLSLKDLMKPSPTVEWNHPFCSQACLLGVMNGLEVDSDCPNYALHPKRTGLNEQLYHIVCGSDVTRLVRTQVRQDPQCGMRPLWLGGARGVLFKIKLFSHGYVFVGKGTIRNLRRPLLLEELMYRQLDTLQGSAVPVCLGLIRLVRRYYFEPGIKIKFMLLLAWGGEMIPEGGGYDGDKSVSRDGISLKTHAWRTERQVIAAGVDQRDFRSANLLWNKERERVMMIDFEGARLLPWAKQTEIPPRVVGSDRLLPQVNERKPETDDEPLPSIVLGDLPTEASNVSKVNDDNPNPKGPQTSKDPRFIETPAQGNKRKRKIDKISQRLGMADNLPTYTRPSQEVSGGCRRSKRLRMLKDSSFMDSRLKQAEIAG